MHLRSDEKTGHSALNKGASSEAQKSQIIVGNYYVHSRDNDDRYPNLDSIEGARRCRAFRSATPLDQNEPPYRFVLASPKPRKPVMVDYHFDSFPVISDKIKEALMPVIGVSGEFFPAIIETQEKTYNYWLFHALRIYDVMDMDRSEYTMTSLGRVSWLDRLVIRYDKLNDVPLQDRLFFKLDNTSGVYLWHETLVRAIEAVQPKGIRFSLAEGYSQDSFFDP